MIAEANCLLSSMNTLKKMNLFVIITQDKNMAFIFAVNSEVGKSIKHKSSKLDCVTH